MSRPRWSVPSRKVLLPSNTVPGGAKGTRVALGGKGASHGAASAARTQKRIMPSPIKLTQLLRSWTRVLMSRSKSSPLTLTLSRGGRGHVKLCPMHIKLSTPRKLLWHYRVATPTIMPASKELPDDDHTTGGPCHA